MEELILYFDREIRFPLRVKFNRLLAKYRKLSNKNALMLSFMLLVLTLSVLFIVFMKNNN